MPPSDFFFFGSLRPSVQVSICPIGSRTSACRVFATGGAPRLEYPLRLSRPLPQPHRLERFAPLDRRGDRPAHALHESRPIRRVADVALRAELRGLQLQVRALELWMRLDALCCADRSVAEGSSGLTSSALSPWPRP